MLNRVIILKFDKRDWGRALLLIASIIGLSWPWVSTDKTVPDTYQLILIDMIVMFLVIIAVLSAGAVCLKIYDAMHEKKSSPDALNTGVIFDFDGRHWVQTGILMILVVGLLCLIVLFYLK